MKKPNYLKGLRVVLAILIFVPILLFFVDFADVLPDNLHTLLHLQIMPAILGGMAGLVVFQFVLALLFGFFLEGRLETVLQSSFSARGYAVEAIYATGGIFC